MHAPVSVGNKIASSGVLSHLTHVSEMKKRQKMQRLLDPDAKKQEKGEKEVAERTPSETPHVLM